MAISKGNLVLYKNHPAVVLAVSGKIEILLPDAATRRVRDKDVQLLHPGPLQSLEAVLRPPATTAEVETAWELLQGQSTTARELSELVYGTCSPAAVWATWKLVSASLHFRGKPDEIAVISPEEVERERHRRATREAEAAAWSGFLDHLRTGAPEPEDEPFLLELEKQARGQRHNSRALGALGRSESPENAHALLLEIGRWDNQVVPYTERLGLALIPPDADLPPPAAEDRLDLTHLTALAIDDPDSRDPDDALSLEDGRLWVHVADPGAMVTPGSDADTEAQIRGSNLYLPDRTIPMLPPAATARLGLGLAATSPALSFALDLNDGVAAGIEIHPSLVRVQRLSYAEADAALHTEPLAGLNHLAQELQGERWAQDAVMIEWPEARIRATRGLVTVSPVEPTQSRELVAEAMLAAGAAIAEYAVQHQIPIPFSTQAPPSATSELDGLAGMFALRKSLQRSLMRTSPAPHAGLGLEQYTQATSPLRRYVDLLVHQQLRAHLRGEMLLTLEEVMERLATADAAAASARQAERLSNRHWTLVYLAAQPGWSGTGVVIERRDRRATIVIPELALETSMALPAHIPPNAEITIALAGIDLPRLDAHFQFVG